MSDADRARIEDLAAAANQVFGANRSHHVIRCRLKMIASIEDAA